MKVLIAVITCHKYRERADAQRATWVKDAPPGADIRFFLGKGPAGYKARPDEVVLDVPDDYYALVIKVQAMCRWAHAHGYDYVYKSDDDAYVQVDRLLESGFAAHDYVGRLRGPSGGWRAPYASGLGYWLSARAMEVLAGARIGNHRAEDRWAGNTLCDAGIRCFADYRYAVVASKRNFPSAQEGPRQGNDIIAACEYDPRAMTRVHEAWKSKPSAQPPPARHRGALTRVNILIKTFLRDGYLFRCVEGIRKRLPEARMVIVDDGFEARKKLSLYAKLRREGHRCVWLPFDSGFGEKANAALPYLDRGYVLIGSDDFNFDQDGVREGIEKMVAVLDHDSSIAVASGRVNNNPYESLLEFGGSNGTAWVKSVRGYREERHTPGGIAYQLCDLTVNYSLIRNWIFRSSINPQGICWDGGEVKIGGGEHGAFYVDLKRAGYGVAYVPGANINELGRHPQWEYPTYGRMRARARAPGLLCLRKRGIHRWQRMDGVWETA